MTFVNRMMGILRGGGELFDLNMARALSRLGVQVQFVVGRRPVRIDQPLDEFETHYVVTPYLRSVSYRYCDSSIRAIRAVAARVRRLDDFMFERAAFRYLKNDHTSDVFQLCTTAQLGARLADIGRKAVVRWPGPPSPRSAAHARKVAATFSHGASYDAAVKLLPDTHHIVAGCDTDLFRPPDARPKIKGECRFIFVGRCIPVKNLAFLLQAFALARASRPLLKLTIVGDGALLADLRRKSLVLGLGDAVRFAGFLTGEALAEEYRTADCFTLVSTYESFSLVCLEAMASGLPLILTNVGHLPTFVNRFAAGTLVEPTSHASLADALVRWADDPEERERVGRQNRLTVEENFSWEASARRLLELYESLTEPGGSGR